MEMGEAFCGEQWLVLMRLLPPGWQDHARASGALRRRLRNFDDPVSLLRVLMIHLVDGCSLRETATRARQGGLADVSDVALLKRLKRCGEWFRWIGAGLMRQYVQAQPQTLFPDVNVRLIDGSIVNEPGATGSNWRLHYSIALPSLRCDEVHVTLRKTGETFRQFQVAPGDLLVGDRGFAQRQGIAHVVQQQGHVLVRLNLTNVPLETAEGHPFELLPHLRGLSETELGDWPAWTQSSPAPNSERIPVRICAIRKSAHATEQAQEKLRREATRQKRELGSDTLEAAGYIFVLTTLPPRYPTGAILEMYRGRWQIELAFKRLKSLMDVGHLKKTDEASAKAWLQGKLMIAFPIEALIAAGESFFPWGYPLGIVAEASLPVAGDRHDAPSG